MNPVSLLVIEDRIDCPLLDLCPLAVNPGLVREKIQADIRVCASLTEAEYVPAGNINLKRKIMYMLTTAISSFVMLDSVTAFKPRK